MSTPWIVEPLDVVKHVRTSIVPGGVVSAVQALAFDRREEALDRRVVPAVAPPAHAAGHTLIGEQPLDRGAVLCVDAIGAALADSLEVLRGELHQIRTVGVDHDAAETILRWVLVNRARPRVHTFRWEVKRAAIKNPRRAPAITAETEWEFSSTRENIVSKRIGIR